MSRTVELVGSISEKERHALRPAKHGLRDAIGLHGSGL